MNRLLNGLVYVLTVAVIIYSVLVGGGDAPEGQGPAFDSRRPAPQAFVPPAVRPGPRGDLPSPSRRDPEVIVQVGEKRPSSGTAFAIGGPGVWMTARHVVDGCSEVFLLTGERRGVRVRDVKLHRNADLAVLFTRGGPDALPLTAAGLDIGQDGFAPGYPQGKAADLHTRLLGRSRLRSIGRYSTNEPAITWAEQRRAPAFQGSLGGLSGGPMLDASGALVGVVVAESRRRGRVTSAAPVSIRNLLADLDVTPTVTGPSPQPAFTAVNFVRNGQSLRRSLTVSKVVCRVARTPRRPRF